MIWLREKLFSSKGFSLIELMVVIAIIGILGAIAIPSYLGVQKKAKRGEFKTNLEILRLLEEKRYAETGSYMGGADTAALKANFSEFQPSGNLLYTYSIVLTDVDQGFVASATGTAKSPDSGLVFTVDEDNNRTGW